MGLPLRSAPTRLLDDRDLPAVRELLARNPIADVFVASRVEAAGLDPWRLGAEMWGHTIDGRLAAVCYSGATPATPTFHSRRLLLLLFLAIVISINVSIGIPIDIE